MVWVIETNPVRNASHTLQDFSPDFPLAGSGDLPPNAQN